MKETQNIPRSGDLYRHFKGNLYQIVALAEHSETGEEMVVYQALYGDYRVWVRPLSMFLSEVDHEKYPEVRQRLRFEPVLRDGLSEIRETGKKTEEEPEEPKPNPYMMEFFDALDSDSYDDKLKAAARLRGHVTQKEMDDIYVVLDMQPVDGSVDEQLSAVRSHLLLLRKFDGDRLR